MVAEQIASVALTPLELACSALVTASLLAAATAALGSALRVQIFADDDAHAACRRHGRVAFTSLVIWYLASPFVDVPRELPLILAIAAFDCWLIVSCARKSSFPTAIARARSLPT